MSNKDDPTNKLLPDGGRSDDYSNKSQTKDKFNLVYCISMLLGAGNLIAYNFLVGAPD